ncbi:hypothetical protein BG61_25340 [Caballeronia glathei]|jgi:hypothetical protein|uniref:Uncharacterized protein n=2 Tax=Caballeronia glathei TaxID=60547 RepID=A0A069Q2U5_9BURK|nr:hypothetical protein BG61_25340 [Caballeronia glathei]
MAGFCTGLASMMPNETVIAARAPTTPRTPAAWRAYARMRRSALYVAQGRVNPHGRQEPLVPSQVVPPRPGRPLSAFPVHF